jgi:hypothetical protein
LGNQRIYGFTDAQGVARLTVNLLSLPGVYEAKAVYDGDEEHGPSDAATPFTLERQPTRLGLAPEVAYVQPGVAPVFTATLEGEDGGPLLERTVLFLIEDSPQWKARTAITDFNGRARPPMPVYGEGMYELEAVFGETVVLPGGQTLSLDDGRYGASAATARWVVDSEAPSIRMPGDLEVPNDRGQGGAVVTYEVTATDNSGAPVQVESHPPSGSFFPLGTTPVDVTATDAAGNRAQGRFNVTVVDGEPPSILKLEASVQSLWPPNRQWVFVRVRPIVRDNTGEVHSRIISVKSSEPAKLQGKSASGPDYTLLSDLTLLLRADRAGTGTGRTYTITVECSDQEGNTATGSVAVFVPKNQSKLTRIQLK